MTDFPRLVPCGDRALLVYLGDAIDSAVNARVHALARALRQNPHPALVEVTPSYHCLMVEYDPVRLPFAQLEELVRSTAAQAAESNAAPGPLEIPVCYGGEMGADLESVAAQTGMTPDEVIQRHTAPLYRVYCLGFSPGFPYLGGLDPALAVPRLAEPRTRVPGGSVGIGGSQTGIYPAPSPGGWQLIGRTPLRLFDPFREPPALLEPGQTVRFISITPEQFALTAAEQARQEPALPAYLQGYSGLRIIQPGMATTLQDLGRRGYQAYGVPVAGAADFGSLMVGNWLLANRARTPALEITLSGPEIEFTGPLAFCLTGAPIQAELIPADGSSPYSVPGWTALLAGPGDRLRIGSTLAGCRSYLCVAGGFHLPPVLGSLSEDLFGHVGPFGRPLKAGDWLPVGLPLHPPADLAGRSLPADMIPTFTGQATVRAVRGPQSEAFTPEAAATFFSSEYVVSPQSDRQGLRLSGPQIAHRQSADILSEPIPPGAVQVPANGQPILLMGNRQTIGGYTKIAVAVYPDLAQASQLRPGDKLRFQEVDLAEAHAIARTERKRLGQIRRYLERQLGFQPEDLARLATAAPASDPSQVPVTAPAPAQTHANVRTFRITISGIEFEARVEEETE